MAMKTFIAVQPIEGVPVVKIGERFLPLTFPIDSGKDGKKFWFIYQGTKKGKLIIDPEKMVESLEEVSDK